MLPFRQVHLDFHTHGSIEEVGLEFDPDEFAGTLEKARVNSINLFARCHHGYLYYHSKRFAEFQHPQLRRDLLRDQIQACHARGIRAPIYISVQWDALQAELHPEWLVRDPKGKVNMSAYEPGFYNTLCLNSPYQDYLKELVCEIAEMLPTDGFWFDILLSHQCSCRYCRDAMAAQGLDPAVEKLRYQFADQTLDRFKREMSALVRYRLEAPLIFYNSGHVSPKTRSSLDAYSHLELESLPSGGWGYDHFPSAVRYARTLGKEYLGMTGKFHTAWGDFHSFKNPEALQFECFSMLAHAGKCCVGDQLHPRGRICPHTYELIGSVYREVERREPWCDGAKSVVDIGVLTPEEFTGTGAHADLPNITKGALHLLQELQHQFDFVDSQADFDRYRLLILPDDIPVSVALAEKITAYLAGGGSLIASHRAGLNSEGTSFMIPMGVNYCGVSPFTPVFLKPRAEWGTELPLTEYVMYEAGSAIEAQPGATVLADAIAPYFNRSWQHYCSHLHAPSSGNVCGPAVVESDRTIYFAQPIFTQYSKNAPRWCRTLLKNAIDRLLLQPLLRVKSPPTLIATVTQQPQLNRRMIHLLHYLPIRTNLGIDIVDEIVPLFNVEVSMLSDTLVTKVRCVPELNEIPFKQNSGRVHFTLPKLQGYQIIEVSWGGRQ